MSSPARSRRRTPWLLGGICALLALLLVVAMVIGAIWFFALRSSPQDAVEQKKQVSLPLPLPDEQLPFFQGGHLRRFHQTGHQNRIGNLTYLPK